MTASGYPRLSADAVTVRFGGVAALSEVTLDLGQGEILGLIGANGAGKSTLINVLSGFQQPTSGTVSLGERQLGGLRPHRLARAGIARTFQSVRLFAGLTVADNVAAVAAVGAAPQGSDFHDPQRLLSLMGLASRSDQLAGALPYADQRRLAIARTLALAPKYLLLDEPAAGMSRDEASDLTRVLRGLVDQTGIGLLLVEHNMDVVMSVSDRITVLDVGRVIASDTPAGVRANPAVLLAYLGTTVGHVHATA